MIVKQKNLRVFYISIKEKKDFIEYFEKNKMILIEYFLLIDGNIDKNIEKILNDAKVCYKNISMCSLKFLNTKKEIVSKVIKTDLEEKEIFEEPNLQEKLKIFERPIRSGEEVNEELPVVVFGHVNSGGKLFCTQSVSIYGIIDGLVQCDGEFIVLNGLGTRGNLIFNGEIIDRELLQNNVSQKITVNNSAIKIEEV
ncbi:MAG: septum site-determining protein MinC [Sulfurospirillum sp.]|nr:septum site-determining protein MinC [Sulfurospirillum sp.]MBL0702833.1 septum site-determining protein MinC [Sulfurospirillum sp.]